MAEVSALEQRINRIKQVKIDRDNAEELKQEQERNKRTLLFQQIRELAPRIKDLCTLANTCTNNGIKLSEDYRYYSYNRDKYFYTDGINHFIGFKHDFHTKGTLCSHTSPYLYIGIENGGACGRYDLWVGTDGEVICTDNSNFPYKTVDKSNVYTHDLEEFVKGFEAFETRFLNWIDNVK